MAGLCALSHYYKLWGDIESIRDFDVCFSVDTGWNTVEEHIPVLYYIKSHYKNAKILTILLEDNTMEMIREHSDLWEQLQECSDIILYNSFPYYEAESKIIQGVRRLKLSLFHKLVKRQLYQTLDGYLHGHFIWSVLCSGGDTVQTRYLHEMYPEGGSIYVVHGQCPFIGMHTLPFLASAPFTRWAATSEQEHSCNAE